MVSKNGSTSDQNASSESLKVSKTLKSVSNVNKIDNLGTCSQVQSTLYDSLQQSARRRAGRSWKVNENIC